MVALIGKEGKRKRRERKGREREGQLPESSFLGVVPGHESATIMPLFTRMLIITNPTLPCDLSLFKENEEKVKQSYNIKKEITNQYYQILIK